MSKPIIFSIKESIADIKKLIKSHNLFMSQRLRVLIECKKHELTGISKRELSENTGYNHNSVQKWRRMYIDGGIEVLLSHNKKGFKPSSFTASEYEILKNKLNESENGLVGYKELQEWVETTMGIKIKYKTLYSFVRTHFGTKIKVARKSHVKKNSESLEAFKKTSVRFVPKL